MAQAAAPVISIVGDVRAQAEAAAWAPFVGAEDEAAFFEGWLALLAAALERPRGLLLLVAGEEAGVFSVAAVWLDASRDLTYLGPAAQQALAWHRGVVVAPGGCTPAPDGAAYVAFPIDADGRPCAAVVADIAAGGNLQGDRLFKRPLSCRKCPEMPGKARRRALEHPEHPPTCWLSPAAAC